MIWSSKSRVINSGDQSTNIIAGGNVHFSLETNIPVGLIDQKISEEIDRLRKSRFFSEFDSKSFALQLGRRIADRDLKGGTGPVRALALAWCSRILARSPHLSDAERFLSLAEELDASCECKVAQAFIMSEKGDDAKPLAALAKIDLPISRSAALMIVAQHKGARGAANWMASAGYHVSDLDAEGKGAFLSYQLENTDWNDVACIVRELSESDFKENPFLHYLTALATLIPTVPEEFRGVVLTQVPFESKNFPLASDALGMDARRKAREHFILATEAADKLDLSDASKRSDEYALWLELLDPEQHVHGKEKLHNKLRDLKAALGFVHHGLKFGIKLDLAAVELEIERSIAINGGMTIDASVACFALAFTRRTPEDAANYIARRYDQLASHIDVNLLKYRQIELLSQAGLLERAHEILSHSLKEGLLIGQEQSLRRLISEAHKLDPIQSRMAQYQMTDALGDLINLVAELEDRQKWDDLCKFAEYLFERTHSLRDAERLARAYNETYKHAELVVFIRKNSNLLPQSSRLRMFYAWGLYFKGEFFELRGVLPEMEVEIGDSNYRALQVNLWIATGDWASLATYVADEYRNRKERSARELLKVADLALHLDLLHARELILEAAGKAGGDAHVLSSSYFMATSAGWESDPRVFKWLEEAASLSGENGPIRKIRLEDLVDQQPEWNRRESETWRMLADAKIPMFLAANSLNRTLIDLAIFPALSNLTEPDPRRRTLIPAYSGKHISVEFPIEGKAIALDATAILTLSFLKILDITLGAFDTVYVPHSTLAWLFRERRKAAFHQPSRIRNAHHIRNLIAIDALQKFNATTVADSDLSAQIGDGLAAFIAEAEKTRDAAENVQHVVIRPSPVHRLSTLMDELADLSAHSSVLCTCSEVVRKLRNKGAITRDEETRAYAYLRLHEEPWPDQPKIEDNAILYLDDLTVSYFLNLGLLEKIKLAGLTAVVSAKEIIEVNALISYERISDEVKSIIESTRASLNSGIESGRIRVSEKQSLDEERASYEHPSLEILSLAPFCDVAVIDDRFFNQHQNIEYSSAQVPIVTTLDLLDALVLKGVLSDDVRLEHRTRLRRAGYLCVPISEMELSRSLQESSVSNGKVVETAELKAIRESVLRVRMSDWLSIPEEVNWLDRILDIYSVVLVGLWESNSDIDETIIRSNWLEEQIDIRGWAHCLNPNSVDDVIQHARAIFVIRLLTPPAEVSKEVVDAYWVWAEGRILRPLQEQFPKVFRSLVDWYRSNIINTLTTESREEAKL